ncbi:MAG: hypothetical protein ACTIJJ_00145 [Galactobacter sp.]
MATNHGSHDGGTDATKGTGAVHSAPGNGPSDGVAPPANTPPERSTAGQDLGDQVHPEVAALKNVITGLMASALTAASSRADHPASGNPAANLAGPAGTDPASPTGGGSASTSSTPPRLDLAALSDEETLASIGQLETIGRIIESVQAVLTSHLIDSRTAEQKAKDRSPRNVRAGVIRDVSLHRGLNATRARKVVDVAIDAPTQAPRLFEEFSQGQVSEDYLVTFFDETTLLTADGKRQADTDLADDAPQLGERELRHRLRFTTAQLEPELAAERARKAAEQRHVSVRPRPDSMANLTALLPGAVAMAIDSILTRYAKSKRAAGEDRLETHIKADALTGIVIGWAEATGHIPRSFTQAQRIKGADTDTDAAAKEDGFLPGFTEVDQARDAFAAFLRSPEGPIAPTGSTHPTGVGQHSGLHARVGVQVNIVITDLALFGIQDTPAEIFGLGPVPAETARTMIATATAHHMATLKRLYTDPVSGALVAMESKSRTFPDGLAQMIGFRDKFCRHPYCNSPIKHLDHITPHATGGPTSFANGQGLCAHHNLIKDSGNTTTTPQPAASTPVPLDGTPAPTGTATAPNDTDPSPIGTTSLPNGTGPITTHLLSGASFTSPARPFPHENATTIASTHYWTGYRAGTAAAQATLTQREDLMRLGQDANYAFADKLKKAAEHAKKVRTSLADEYQELTRLQAEQQREAEELQRQRATLDRDANTLGRLRTHVEALLTDLATQRDKVEAQRSSTTAQRDHVETQHPYIEAPPSGLESRLHAWALSAPAVAIHHSATAFLVAGMAATLKLTTPSS